MSKNNKTTVEEEVVEEEPKSLVDEFAVSAFSSMGVQVTPAIANSYNKFKRLKDMLQPGRLNPADFVVCVMLSKGYE